MTLGVTDDQNYVNIANALREMGSGAEDLAFTPGEIPAAIRGLRSIWGTIEGSILDQTDLQNALNGKANANHDHDSRYYTENEIDTKLNGKSNTGHTHDDRYYTETEIDTKLNGKSNIDHTHDERYYTETEIDNKFDENTIIKSASGPIVSFSDGVAAPAGNVTVAIEPVQSGTGDPSPENMRPITGWTGAKVMRTGKNLLPSIGADTVTTNGITFTKQSDGSIKVNGTATGTANYRLVNTDKHLVLKAGTYIVTGGTYIYGQTIAFVRADDGTTQYMSSGNALTLSTDVDYQYVFIRIAQGLVLDNVIFYPMIRLASDPDDTYEPYQGDTYDISFGEAGTVYGGSLDVSSGVLTVIYKYVTINGNSNIGKENDSWNPNNNTYYYRISPIRGKYVGHTNIPNIICNQCQTASYKTVKESTDVNLICFTSTGSDIDWTSSSTTIADEKARLAENPLQLVYELDTPLTYQLTPAQVTILLGQNNIWADTGDVDVSYFTEAGEDVGKAFDNMSKSAKYDDDKTREMITQSSESAMTASKNYTAGNLIIINDKLIRATANIASGGAITIGTNAEEVDLDTVISEKVNSYVNGSRTDTIDLNNYINTGFYSIFTENLNSPTNTNGNLLVIKGTSFIHQIAFLGNDAIWMRRKSGSDWNAWKKFTGA